MRVILLVLELETRKVTAVNLPTRNCKKTLLHARQNFGARNQHIASNYHSFISLCIQIKSVRRQNGVPDEVHVQCISGFIIALIMGDDREDARKNKMANSNTHR